MVNVHVQGARVEYFSLYDVFFNDWDSKNPHGHILLLIDIHLRSTLNLSKVNGRFSDHIVLRPIQDAIILGKPEVVKEYGFAECPIVIKCSIVGYVGVVDNDLRLKAFEHFLIVFEDDFTFEISGLREVEKLYHFQLLIIRLCKPTGSYRLS